MVYITLMFVWLWRMKFAAKLANKSDLLIITLQFMRVVFIGPYWWGEHQCAILRIIILSLSAGDLGSISAEEKLGNIKLMIKLGD